MAELDTAAAPATDANSGENNAEAGNGGAPSASRTETESVDYSSDQRLSPKLRERMTGTKAEEKQQQEPPKEPGQNGAEGGEEPGEQTPGSEPQDKRSRAEERLHKVMAERARERAELQEARQRIEQLEREKQGVNQPPKKGQPPAQADDGPNPEDFIDDESGEFNEAAFRSAQAKHIKESLKRELKEEEAERQIKQAQIERNAKVSADMEAAEEKFIESNPDYVEKLSKAESFLFEIEETPERDASGKFTGNTVHIPVAAKNPTLVGLVAESADPAISYAIAKLAETDPNRLKKLVNGDSTHTVREFLKLALEAHGTPPAKKQPVIPRAPQGGSTEVLGSGPITESQAKAMSPAQLVKYSDAIDKSIMAGTYYGK